jgi:heptosyltransferase-3
MKILVVQLARLGDIYQTWPALGALKRIHPDAEIHLLTRSKFAAAAPGPALLTKHWLLDTRDVLAPLIDEKPAIDTSMEKLDTFCAELRDVGFDRVINLSFSAFSSYLVGQVTRETTMVQGYTRFEDGYLNIPDDGSAYFYAQVGVGRANRLHVTDLFAHVAGVELTEADWSFTQKQAVDSCDQTVLLHVGASTLDKTLSWSKWLQVVRGLLTSSWRGTVVLVGSSEEAELAQNIAAISGERKPVNLVGQTTLAELFEMVGESALVIGGDSAPVQMASLTATPVLNVSLPMVCFWETGPRAKGSRILPVESEQAVSTDEIVGEALAMLAGHSSKMPIVRVPGPTFPYVETRPQPRSFEWELLRAMYLGEAVPPPASELFLLGMRRLADVNLLAIEQIDALKRNPHNKTASAILDRTDEIMSQIAQMVPETDVMIRWFRTERLRIGPMSMEQLTAATENAHRRFADVISLYVDLQGEAEVAEKTKGDASDDVVLG